MRDDERGVGKRLDKGRELLEVLGRLEHPAGATPEPLQHLEHPVEVRVRGALVAGQVGVAPGRHRGRRLEQHGGEVDGQELYLLVGVPDRHLVHPVEVGQGGVEEGQRHLGALHAGVGCAGPGDLPVGEDRLQALPVGERPQRGVGGHQVVQVRGAGARQPADDDRRDDLLVQDLGMPPDEVLNQQPVLQQPEDEDVLLHDAGAVEATLLAHGVAQHLESPDEIVGAEVLESGFGAGGGHELRRGEGQL